MFPFSSMPTTTAVLSAYTTVAASAVLVRTLMNEVQNMASQVVPKELQEKILSKLGYLLGNNHSSQICVVIDENTNGSINEMFAAAELYLQTKITPSVKKLKVSRASGENSLSVTVNKGETIVDVFDGIQFMWQMISVDTQKAEAYDGYLSSQTMERKSFELTFSKKCYDRALSSYLPHVFERSEAMKAANKVVKLQTLGGCYSGPVVLNHPSTFDTLAMDPAIKEALIDDLDRFLKRRDYYRRTGRAWKRGYLLYGPPGTGKSSLVAAMANYLKFDIYDMELASLSSNADFRHSLLTTKNRSILVIEDIDCSIDLENREEGAYKSSFKGGMNLTDGQLTLSGLLNFIDGLWSSCGDERIIVFTTNHKDRLDPALLRPGRMDMHINMSYCTPEGFKILAYNYLGIRKHERFGEIEKLLKDAEATPAEIAEQLIRSEEADTAIEGLIKFLNMKIAEQDEKLEVNDGGNWEEKAKPGTTNVVNSNKRKVISGEQYDIEEIEL